MVVTGVQVSLGAYGEAVEISSVKQTECMTEIEQKGNPSWTLGNQGNYVSTWTVEWKRDILTFPTKWYVRFYTWQNI